MLFTITVINIFSIVLLISLIISARHKTQFLDGKLFFILLLIALVECFVSISTLWLNGKMFKGAYTLSIIMNTIEFSINIFLPYIWLLYVDYKIFGRLYLNKKYPVIFASGIFLTFISIIINAFYPIYFYISPENIYIRKQLIIIPFIVNYVYLLFTLLITFAYRKKYEKYLFFPIAIFLFPIFIASIIQFFVNGLSVIWASVAIALNYLYITIQSEESFIDDLTGLYSRRYFHLDIERFMTGMREDTFIGGVMIDVDKFKNINDTYSHITGDAVLKSIAKILRNSVDYKAKVYRYAGDEFIILKRLKNKEDMNDIINSIEKNLNKFNQSKKYEFNISISMGSYVLKEKNITPDKFIYIIDSNMYKNKNSKEIREN